MIVAHYRQLVTESVLDKRQSRVPIAEQRQDCELIDRAVDQLNFPFVVRLAQESQRRIVKTCGRVVTNEKHVRSSAGEMDATTVRQDEIVISRVIPQNEHVVSSRRAFAKR